MDTLKKLFPFSFRATDLKSLLITILIYIIADFVCGLVIGILGKLPIIGVIFSIIGAIVGIYFFVAIIIAILDYAKVLK